MQACSLSSDHHGIVIGDHLPSGYVADPVTSGRTDDGVPVHKDDVQPTAPPPDTPQGSYAY